MTAHVYAWPRHVLHGGPLCPCEAEADARCVVCEGGLAWCVVCGGAEAGLPTHCPGQHMGQHRCDAVQAGTLDYHVLRGWEQVNRRVMR